MDSKKLKSSAENIVDEEDNGERPNFFGIKSYLHNFYENVSFKNPNECEDHDSDLMAKDNQRSFVWRVAFIVGFSLMMWGAAMILIGFTYTRMKIDIGYQEEMRIIDKSAYEFNQHLDQFRIVGLICFACGGIMVASSLLLPSFLFGSYRIESIDQHEATHLKLSIETEVDEGETRAKNLIPVTEQLKVIQPKQTPTTIITNSGLKQIGVD